MTTNTTNKIATIGTNNAGQKALWTYFSYCTTFVTEMRMIPGAVWDSTKKCWVLPLSVSNCIVLLEKNYFFKKELREWYHANRDKKPVSKSDLKIEGLQGNLIPFQAEGVVQVEHWNGRAVIADEMGLGKTVQALAWLQLRKDARPCVIICPASLKLNWQKEALKWMDGVEVIVLSGREAKRPNKADLYIINYDIVDYWLPVFFEIGIQAVILDEMHYIKKAGTKADPVKRTRAVMKLCKGVPHVIGLTGTPIENKALELYNPIRIINPNLFPSEWLFKHRYCGAKHNGFGWTFNGATNTQELHKILTEQVMVRRLKKDVLKDLPDKQYSFIPFEIENKKEYQKAYHDFLEWLGDDTEKKVKESLKDLKGILQGVNIVDSEKMAELKQERIDKANALSQIETLKQLAVIGKLNGCLDWVMDFLENDEKLVVFATHKFVIDAVMKRFNKIAVKVDGSVSIQKRQDAVDAFQNNKKVRLFVGNIQAAGVGLTLTSASNVAFLEYPWTPGGLNQAIDRCHRIGQKNCVGVHFLTAVNTIDENIIQMLHNKQGLADSVLDGKMLENTALLSDLINKFKKELL